MSDTGDKPPEHADYFEDAEMQPRYINAMAHGLGDAGDLGPIRVDANGRTIVSEESPALKEILARLPKPQGAPPLSVRDVETLEIVGKLWHIAAITSEALKCLTAAIGDLSAELAERRAK